MQKQTFHKKACMLSVKSQKFWKIKDFVKKPFKISQKKLTDPNILLAQRKIEENIGLDTKIINRTNGSGKVVIGYNNLDQFDLLSKLLTKKK